MQCSKDDAPPTCLRHLVVDKSINKAQCHMGTALNYYVMRLSRSAFDWMSAMVTAVSRSVLTQTREAKSVADGMRNVMHYSHIRHVSPLLRMEVSKRMSSVVDIFMGRVVRQIEEAVVEVTEEEEDQR